MVRIEIVEILGRSRQGITRPFLCRAEDDNTYYVKGSHAGFSSLCAEWLCSQLCVRLELPVAPPRIVWVPPELIEGSYIEGIADLGEGWAFGSQRIENSGDLRHSDLPRVVPSLPPLVLAFDWWIQNPDRILSGAAASGNNPNLLWSTHKTKLHLIDHGNAFALPRAMDGFWKEHVFAAARPLWKEPWCGSILGKMRHALNNLDEVWYGMPERWIDISEETGGLTIESARSLLEQCNLDLFWQGTLRTDAS